MEVEIVGLLVAAIGAIGLSARALGNVSQSAGEMARTVKALNDELQEVVKERRDGESERARLKVELQALTEQTCKTQGAVDNLERESARLTGELDQAKAEIVTLRAEKEAQHQTILNLEKEIGRLQFELTAANEAKAKAETEIERLRQDFDQMKANGKGADHA